MSATIARHAGHIQLEQSDMRLALNMAKMAKAGHSGTRIAETHYLILTPRTKVQEETKWGVEFPEHRKVKVQSQDTCLCCIETTQPDAFLAKMIPQRIHRQTGVVLATVQFSDRF